MRVSAGSTQALSSRLKHHADDAPAIDMKALFPSEQM